MRSMLLIMGLLSFSCTALGRSIFLNGTDISSAFNQSMEKVDVRIDDKGNIFIAAPHYQILTQDSYVPLGKAQEDHPPHRTIPQVILTPEQKEAQQEEKNSTSVEEKTEKVEENAVEQPSAKDVPQK